MVDYSFWDQRDSFLIEEIIALWIEVEPGTANDVYEKSLEDYSQRGSKKEEKGKPVLWKEVFKFRENLIKEVCNKKISANFIEDTTSTYTFFPPTLETVAKYPFSYAVLVGCDQIKIDRRSIAQWAKQHGFKPKFLFPESRGEADKTSQTAFPSIRTDKDYGFKKRGEYWIIGPSGKEIFMKHRKGYNYIHILLQYPNKSIHALTLEQIVSGIGIVDKVDNEISNLRADETNSTVGDQKMLGEYQERLAEIKDEQTCALAIEDDEEHMALENERKIIINNLKSIKGTGGLRKFSSNPEKARSNITKQINSALELILNKSPDLKEVLTIDTGIYLSYTPQKPNISWDL